MTSLLDNLSALLIGSAIILLLAASWARTVNGAAVATRVYEGRSRIEVLREVLDRDMASLGAGVPAAEQAVVTHTWTGTTRTFEFKGRVAASAGSPADQIRYTATSQTCSAGSGTCWRFRRLALTGSAFVSTGLDLELASVDIQLTPAGAPTAATGVTVRMALPASARPVTSAARLDRYYRLVNQETRLAN